VTFVFVSGNLALDFVGTLKWRRDLPEELLATPADAARWAVEAGVLTRPERLNDRDLGRLSEGREVIYRLMSAAVDQREWPGPDLAALNAQAQSRPPDYHLTSAGLERSGGADAIGWAVARSAAELLSRTAGLRLRECQGERCTRIFVDRSRTGNRRWCGMEECGNRIKAAHYRARKAQPDRA
jgi:predicted RNA-binding Zn ribbon-like protein